MENFTAYNPTALHFGKDVLKDLGSVVASYGRKVLLVYGKGSVKENGLYQEVMRQMTNLKIEVYEYSGIRPNPIVEDVDAAASLGRDKQVDCILAIGGGSVIDSAKVISLTIPVYHSAWDFYSGKAKARTAVPLVAVLTLAATGTEMNKFAVIQNNRSKNKAGWGHDLMYPAHSFLDPGYTLSVPVHYTAYGITDLIAHALEAYFGKGEASLPDRFVFAIIREAMEYGPQLMQNLRDYTLREKIMYAATMALNGLTLHGRAYGDWGVHGIGHTLSVLFDTPHGASLSVAYPAWLRLMQDRIPERIENLGLGLFGEADITKTITRLEDFFKSIGSPVSLQEAGIGEAQIPLIREHMLKSKLSGAVQILGPEDYDFLLSKMLHP